MALLGHHHVLEFCNACAKRPLGRWRSLEGFKAETQAREKLNDIVMQVLGNGDTGPGHAAFLDRGKQCCLLQPRGDIASEPRRAVQVIGGKRANVLEDGKARDWSGGGGYGG